MSTIPPSGTTTRQFAPAALAFQIARDWRQPLPSECRALTDAQYSGGDDAFTSWPRHAEVPPTAAGSLWGPDYKHPADDGLLLGAITVAAAIFARSPLVATASWREQALQRAAHAAVEDCGAPCRN